MSNTKPQLSEEIKKLEPILHNRFETELVLDGEDQYKLVRKVLTDISKVIDSILATALEEQRDLFHSWITEGEMENYTSDGLANFLYKKLNGKETEE